MSPEEATEFAVKCFRDRGVEVGEMSTWMPGQDIYFKEGCSCHAREFADNNYIHFHVGHGAWIEDQLPRDAPNERIRRMILNGKDIPEEECYPT